MATKIYKDYTLEHLTANSVNVLVVSSAKVNTVMYEISRERLSYQNSIIGRERLLADLPENYALAVLNLWGDTPTVEDPQGGE